MGAEFLTAADGLESARGYYYEVEVLDAQGSLYIGFAGTNLGTRCARVGNDPCSWSIYMADGDGRHRCVPGRGNQVLGCAGSAFAANEQGMKIV